MNFQIMQMRCKILPIPKLRCFIREIWPESSFLATVNSLARFQQNKNLENIFCLRFFAFQNECDFVKLCLLIILLHSIINTVLIVVRSQIFLIVRYTYKCQAKFFHHIFDFLCNFGDCTVLITENRGKKFQTVLIIEQYV